MNEVSETQFVRAIMTQVKLAETLERGKPDDIGDFRKRLREHAKVIRGVIREMCDDLGVEIPGVNVPEVCIDCGGEDGDHGDECPADKLAALGKNW